MFVVVACACVVSAKPIRNQRLHTPWKMIQESIEQRQCVVDRLCEEAMTIGWRNPPPAWSGPPSTASQNSKRCNETPATHGSLPYAACACALQPPRRASDSSESSSSTSPISDVVSVNPPGMELCQALSHCPRRPMCLHPRPEVGGDDAVCVTSIIAQLFYVSGEVAALLNGERVQTGEEKEGIVRRRRRRRQMIDLRALLR